MQWDQTNTIKNIYRQKYSFIPCTIKTLLVEYKLKDIFCRNEKMHSAMGNSLRLQAPF